MNFIFPSAVTDYISDADSYMEPLLADQLMGRVIRRLKCKWENSKADDKITGSELQSEIKSALEQQIHIRGLMTVAQCETFARRVQLRIDNGRASIFLDKGWCSEIDEIFGAGICPRCNILVPTQWNHELGQCNSNVCQVVLDT